MCVGADAMFLREAYGLGAPRVPGFILSFYKGEPRPQDVTYVSQSPQSWARWDPAVLLLWSRPQTLHPTYPTCSPSAFWVGML